MMFFQIYKQSYKIAKANNQIWLTGVITTWLVIQGMLTNLFLTNYRVEMLFWLVICFVLVSLSIRENNAIQKNVGL
jgi:hypothetical protein